MPATGRKKGAPWSGLPPMKFQQEVERLWPEEMRAPLGFGLPFPFGDGSDGNVTVSGTTSLASHDIKQYLNLTIASGGTLTTTETNAAVLIIYVRERLYVAGTIDMNGNGGNTADGDNADRYAGSGGGGGGGSGGAGALFAGGILPAALARPFSNCFILIPILFPFLFLCPSIHSNGAM